MTYRDTESAALSVSEVVQRAKRSLEQIRVTVVGEVSEYTDKTGYKAVYFSLCDGDAVLPCLMWRREFDASGVSLAEGSLVEVEGFLTVYPAKGRMQFQVRRLTLAGEGVLRMQVAALAKKLQSEGLVADERKRPVPALPERIGVVTSPRGKAVHDVLRTLRRRYPIGEIVFAGVAVEGRGAPAAIVDGLRAVAEAGVDVAILCRGGGSYEDLMPFNDESVARAVSAMPMPVVTGIGHEPDTSIADLVADVRTSTPTAAAEHVAPSVEELVAKLRGLSTGLARGLHAAAMAAGRRFDALAARPVFRDRYALLAGQSQRLDQAAADLGRALPGRLERDRLRLGAGESALRAIGDRVLERQRLRVAGVDDRLRALSPVGILERGYAICFDERGRAVRAAAALAVGDQVNVRFGAGSAGCTIDTIETEGS